MRKAQSFARLWGGFITLAALVVLLAVWGRAEEKEPAAVPGPAQTLTVDLLGGVEMEFVLIQPGSFMMGSEAGKADERPVHRVTITEPFYMAGYEVTQAQWCSIMDANPSQFKGDKNPVERVSWDDCQAFLTKLNERIPGESFRLPTEAEWEYACRAGTATVYSFGDGDSALAEYAWYDGNSEGRTHAAGEKKPNAWGLYDMHGGVWEWCSDWYDGGYYGKSPADDPQGPASGQYRVLRGGSWNDAAGDCRSGGRPRHYLPSYSYGGTGFRLVRSLGDWAGAEENAAKAPRKAKRG